MGLAWSETDYSSESMFLPPLPRINPQTWRASPALRSRNASIEPRPVQLAESVDSSRNPVQRFWLARGNHSRISSQIDPKFHYRDTSLGSIAKRKDRVDQQLQRYQRLKQTYDVILTDRKRKKDVVHEIRAKYAVKFSKREVAASSSAQLALAALSIVNEKQKQEAARKIGRAWRKAQLRKSLALFAIRKKTAARTIQRAWRAHVGRKKNDALLRQQTQAAVKLQKTWRGFSVRRATKELMKEARMKRNFQYFEGIRAKLLADSARMIWKHWKASKMRRTKKKVTERPVEVAPVTNSRKSSDAKSQDNSAAPNFTLPSGDSKKPISPRKVRPSIAPERKSNDRFQGNRSPPVGRKSPALRRSHE